MNESEFIEKLLAVCGGITKEWNDHFVFWEGDERGYYSDISVFVHYVIECKANDKTSEFEQIFKIIEQAVHSKVGDTSELAIIGFLEGILFVGSHKDIRPEDFSDWLGVESMKCIMDLESFFGGDT